MTGLSAGSATIAVLAQNTDVLDAIRTELNTSPSHGNLLIVVGAIVGAALLLALLARTLNNRNGRKSQAPPRRDFLLEAAQVLELGADDRQLLRKLASRTAISPPTAMLLTPANFAQAAQGSLRAEEFREVRQQLNTLCVKLFDVHLPDPADQYLGGS